MMNLTNSFFTFSLSHVKFLSPCKARFRHLGQTMVLCDTTNKTQPWGSMLIQLTTVGGQLRRSQTVFDRTFGFPILCLLWDMRRTGCNPIYPGIVLRPIQQSPFLFTPCFQTSLAGQFEKRVEVLGIIIKKDFFTF